MVLVNYVPEWFPGTKWKQTGKAWKKDLNTMADEPHDFVKKQMVSFLLSTFYSPFLIVSLTV